MIKTIDRWFKWVPKWVWFFIAISQALTIYDRTGALPDLESEIEQINQLPENQRSFYGHHQSVLERMSRQKHREQLVASVIVPIAIALAVLSWLRSRRESLPNATT
jgi:hypothetical protein